MAPHGGDIIADVLFRHHVTHLFALCGGHISPILTGAEHKGRSARRYFSRAVRAACSDATTSCSFDIIAARRCAIPIARSSRAFRSISGLAMAEASTAERR